MEKIAIPSRADKQLIDGVKAIAAQKQWTFQTAIENALSEFVARYNPQTEQRNKCYEAGR